MRCLRLPEQNGTSFAFSLVLWAVIVLGLIRIISPIRRNHLVIMHRLSIPEGMLMIAWDFYIAKQTVKRIISVGKDVGKAKVLVMGATFKEDVTDTRNSKVADVIKELISYGVHVEVTDPVADSNDLKKEYGFELVNKIANDYDAVIVAVNHKEYKKLDESYFKSITNNNSLLVDVKGIYRGKIKELGYWSL